mgnify:CR=1 FL=1
MAKQLLTAANIRYLLVMSVLMQDGKGVRCVDIADSLGITKPSVHTMMNTLRDMQLIRKDRYGEAFFTDDGRDLAERYSRYFDAICGSLSSLLTNEADVKAAAYALLAEVPEASLEEMLRDPDGSSLREVL